MTGVYAPVLASFEPPELQGDNYKIWREKILMYMSLLDIDLALRKDEPPKVTDTSTPTEIYTYNAWEWSNRLMVAFIKFKVSPSIRLSVDSHDNARELLKAIDEQFESSNKALAAALVMKFTSMKLSGVGGIQEYIMEMRDIATQLQGLAVSISDSFLVHFILNSLPAQYGPFKLCYYIHKDKWSINELMTMCVQEEERLLLMEKRNNEVVNMSAHGKWEEKGNKPKERHPHAPICDIKKESRCFFCKKKGHIKKDCQKFKEWMVTKGYDEHMEPK